MPNPCAKTRKVNEPYEIWAAGNWEWRVLKKYQTPEKESQNPYARWFCAVKSEFTFGSYDMGDVYVREIKLEAHARRLSDEELKARIHSEGGRW
jgi:hypothetical protein